MHYQLFFRFLNSFVKPWLLISHSFYEISCLHNYFEFNHYSLL